MKRPTTEVNAGIFIVATLFLFTVSIWVLGSERQLFSIQYEYQAAFRDVGGLREGAPVRLGGITVGRVASIAYSDNIDDPGVYVRFLVNEQFLQRVREDSSVTIQTQGLLGDKFLNLSAGVSPEGVLPEGSRVESQESADISEALAKANKIVDNTAKLSQAFYELVEQFKEETMDSLKKGIHSIANIAKEIEHGDGAVHRLIYSEEHADDIVDALASAASTLEELMDEIKGGNGLLHALIFDDSGSKTLEHLGTAAQNLAVTAGKITEIAHAVTEGDGLLHEMVYGEPQDLSKKIAGIVTELERSTAAIKIAAQAIASGEGTIGALIVDPSLYDNLIEITDEAKRSVLLRTAIRSALDK